MLRSILLVCIAASVASAQDAFSPARFRSGSLPSPPVTAVGGGQVFLEVSVGRDGRVGGVTVLRGTPPFTVMLTDALRSWRFAPAEQEVAAEPGRADAPKIKVAVESRVLVAAMFRAPTLNAPTLGEPPRDLAAPSDEIPFPLSAIEPNYPPLARDGGVVLVETHVGRDGAVGKVEAVRSAPPFDAAALAAVRRWSFRPVHLGRTSVPSIAYVLFGFPVPIGSLPGRGAPSSNVR